jgi:hypothetical protein
LNFTYNSLAVGADQGLRAVYSQDLDRDGNRDPEDVPVLQRTEPTINTDWSTGSPYPGVLSEDYFFVTWTGRFTAPASGQYLFGASHDDTFTVTLNGAQASWTVKEAMFQPGTPNLTAVPAIMVTSAYS